MKKYTPLAILFLLFYCSSVAAAGRLGLLYLQQEKPGEIIYVSIIPRVNDAVVGVVGMGKVSGEKRGAIPLGVYKQYVEILTSKELTQYEFIPKGDESVTGLDFYSVMFETEGVEKMFKLPRNGLKGEAAKFVEAMHQYISNAALTRR